MPPETRYTGASEEELMAAYASGDKAAFEELFSRLAPVLSRMARRHIHAKQDADDVVQQAFFQIHRARLDFKPGLKLRPWVYTITMNLIREHFRRRSRRKEETFTAGTTQEPGVPPADLAGIQESQHARQKIRKALEALPENQRVVIELHWFQDRPFPEVAKIVGASTSAVKVRAHRGYKRLREILGETATEERP